MPAQPRELILYHPPGLPAARLARVEGEHRTGFWVKELCLEAGAIRFVRREQAIHASSVIRVKRPRP